MHREEHAMSMLTHSPNAIFTSLTRLEDPVVIKAAVNCHKCILGYSGDLRATYPESNAINVLCLGIEGDSWIRAEIYAQLMKQLTQNPNNYIQDKVWGLMMLCLLHFNPGEGMENYLQIFIRDYCDDRWKDTLIRQCHVIAYENPATQPPPVHMLQSLLTKNGF